MQPKKTPDPNAPKELGKPLLPTTQITRVRFSPDGKTLTAAGFDGTVKRWDVSGKEPSELPALGQHNGWVTAIAFGAKLLFSADSWGRLNAWEGDKLLWSAKEAHDGWLRSLAVSPDGTQLATGGKDGFVRVWAAADGKKLHERDLKSDILSVIFSPDGTRALAGNIFGKINTVDLTPRGQSAIIEAGELYKLDRIQDVGGVKCLAVSADGKTLFAGGAEPKTGGFVQCVPLLIAFDLASGKRVAQFKGANDNEGYVTDIAPHSDGRVVFTTSGQPGQGKFHVWKVGDAATLFSGGKHPNCHSVALHPDGERIAVSATNANSSGNGRVKGMGGEYPANSSPIQLWALPKI